MARQSHRKAPSNGMQSQGGGSLFDEIYADRRQRAEEANLAKEAESYNFRVRQTELAGKSEKITSLKEGSIAHKLALAVLAEFPAANAYTKADGRKVSRTAAAVEIALEHLTDEEVMREKAVNVGRSNVGYALRAAYAALKDGEPATNA